MGTSGPVAFVETKKGDPTVLTVTDGEGKKYELRIALAATGVVDMGMINPLDGLPVFQISSHLFIQVTRAAHA